jgi:glycosyltransferase involved in cell wall biosynthesis
LDKNKIMLMTDSNLATGFGNISHNIAMGLAAANFDVTFLGWGFKYSMSIPRANYTLLPGGNNPFGDDCLPFYLQQIKPEVLLTQADSRMLMWLPNMLRQIPNHPAWVFYCVIDGSTWDIDAKYTHWPQNWTQVIKAADKVVTMTDYGKNILHDNGVEAETIYHGVDTSLYKPVSEENKRAIKKQAGVPEDTFLFGGVFKNMQRKNPEKYLQAMKIFLESKEISQAEKDKVAMVLHTNPNPGPSGEFDLIEQSVDIGLQPGKNVIFSPNALPMEMMPYVYQSFDVFLHLGTMEGFGLPIIEAMSCGLPVIGVNSCTMPEILGGTGVLTEVPKYNHQNKISFGSYNGVECDCPDPWQVAHKMVQLYKDVALRKELGFKASVRATEVFDWNIIKPKWVKLVKSLVITAEQVPAEWQKLFEETKI